MNLNDHVLSLLAKSNHLGHLKQLQCHLTVLGHAQTQFYAFKLVRFCTLSLSNLHYARLIFNRLESPNTYLYTAMITAYASQPDRISAFLLFRDMVRRRNPKPSQFIYPHVLKSCPEVLGLNGTGLVHAQVLKSGYERYPVVQTSLVDSYSRILGNIGNARKVFDEMCERNVVSWTAMVCGHARMGQWRTQDVMFMGAQLIVGFGGFFFKRRIKDNPHLRKI
ncbi:hypothetical protein QN277_007863 [Acacia crassicarpa]|uniref:Pentatricopeptide repeat-containing protein n=1 Tax=Acacia crassicarpa TaxID=499986 RepID=A0AAE1IVX2_9FABA|nr:hypothetical protein QN277_007863 [Acacia crassicarpa]